MVRVDDLKNPSRQRNNNNNNKTYPWTLSCPHRRRCRPRIRTRRWSSRFSVPPFPSLCTAAAHFYVCVWRNIHGWRLPWEGLQILRFSLLGLQEHKQQIEHIWIQQNFCFLLNIFLRLKYQKNMAPKKSKVKKRIAQPAKGIIERTICAHPMLKRVQKEVRELKKKSAKKHKK